LLDDYWFLWKKKKINHFLKNENGFGFNNTKNDTSIQSLKKEKAFEYNYSFKN